MNAYEVSGSGMSSDEAKHCIMQWCVDGTAIPDAAGGKSRHMNEINPAMCRLEELQPLHELEARALAA